jgi:uncharacterized protein (TIGR02466 family)
MFYDVFPTRILVNEYHKFSNDEKQTLLDLEYLDDIINLKSIRKDVLDSVPELKNWIEHNLLEYTQTAMATKQKLRITQSWCIKHENIKQHIQLHEHVNSIVSGAFYVHAEDSSANLKFVKPNDQIMWKKDKELYENNPSVWQFFEIPSQTARLILFPSKMQHSVSSDNKNLRCVLSFNTWLEGDIGDPESLTFLPKFS